MQTSEFLSDKYEDQYRRLEEAMIALFKYENLLSNEYLVRKFEQDPFNPAQYCLQYVVVQRENSIKSQYVQNELNTRKQYHLILTAILKQYHKVLWNFDQLQLIIRPYFPSERKRIQLKFIASNVEKIKDSINKLDFIQEEPTYETEAYLADKSLIKLFITTKSQDIAEELFTWLMARKQPLGLDSIMMLNMDYLEEFHHQITQRKNDIYANRQVEKPPQAQYQEFDNHPSFQKKEQRFNEEGKGRGRGNYGYHKNDRDEQHENKHHHHRGERGNRGNDRWQGNRDKADYVQKSEANQQSQTQQQQPQQKYHLVHKNNLQKSPKLNVKPDIINAEDFPALDTKQNN